MGALQDLFEAKRFDKRIKVINREIHLSGLPPDKFLYTAKRFRNSLASKEMNVNGLTVPQIQKEFEFKPASDEVFIVCYLAMTIIHDGTFLPTEFGSRAALANGLAVKEDFDTTLGREITTLLDNRDVLDCFAGGIGIPGVGSNVGVFGTGDWIGGRMEFKPYPVLLDGAKGDRIYFEVQDDLTLVSSLTAAMLGYELLT